jgi:hypothetical protein
MSFRTAIKEYAEVPISRHVIMDLLREYRRPNDKISELIKSKALISVRRGLYITGPNLDLPSPSPFLIANHLRGPSYVSLESAMSYWEMIPERVYEISSATTKSSKIYKSNAGRFSYQQLKFPYYAYGLKSMTHSAKQSFLIATPEKALCDKIILTPNLQLRSIKQTRDFLIDDLRIDRERLGTLDIKHINSWIEHAPKKSSLKMLSKTLETL